MNLKRKILLYLLLSALLLPLPSCRRAIEKAQRDIRIEAVEQVRLLGITGGEVTLRVRNDSRHKLVLKEARIGVFYAGKRVVTILLDESAEVPRRVTERVTTRWHFKVSDPLAMYVLVRRLDAGDVSQITLSCDIEGRGGPVPVNISRQAMPLSEFLNIFGLQLADLKNYFGK